MLRRTVPARSSGHALVCTTPGSLAKAASLASPQRGDSSMMVSSLPFRLAVTSCAEPLREESSLEPFEIRSHDDLEASDARSSDSAGAKMSIPEGRGGVEMVVAAATAVTSGRLRAETAIPCAGATVATV